MRLGAVVLAAGASTRMGRPKALIDWRGEPFVAHVVALAKHAGADPIVVVEGAYALPDHAIGGAQRVVNPRWAAGPLGSLQAGVAAVLTPALGRRDAHAVARPEITGVIIFGVDRPHVARATIDAIVRAWQADPSRVWQPQHAGQHGHPIVWPVDLARDLLTLVPPATPRTLLARPEIASRRAFVDVDDAAILHNIDRPEDLARLPSPQ